MIQVFVFVSEASLLQDFKDGITPNRGSESSVGGLYIKRGQMSAAEVVRQVCR